MPGFVAVADGFSVSPQITAADIASAAALGFKTIINNRPDGEAPDQLSDAAARAAAEAAGLAYVAIPVTMPPPRAAAAALAEALAATPGPHLAFCRSGTRSIILWAMAQAIGGADPDALVRAGAEADYDIGAVRPMLAALRGG